MEHIKTKWKLGECHVLHSSKDRPDCGHEGMKKRQPDSQTSWDQVGRAVWRKLSTLGAQHVCCIALKREGPWWHSRARKEGLANLGRGTSGHNHMGQKATVDTFCTVDIHTQVPQGRLCPPLNLILGLGEGKLCCFPMGLRLGSLTWLCPIQQHTFTWNLIHFPGEEPRMCCL